MSEVIVPAHIKMIRLRAELGKISELDFCVLFALYEAVDRKTGLCDMSHDELAAAVNRKRRSVERSTARLEKMGCIKIERKRIGQRAMGGALYGGRGGKNIYNLISDRPSEETVNKVRQAGRERPSGGTHKDRQVGRGTVYTLESHKNPGARASAVDNPPDVDPLQVCWPAVKRRLAQALGREVFDSWFGKVTLLKVEGGVVLLGTPTKFVAKWLTDRYAELTIEAWRADVPDLIDLRFEHRPAAAAIDALPAAEQPVQR